MLEVRLHHALIFQIIFLDINRYQGIGLENALMIIDLLYFDRHVFRRWPIYMTSHFEYLYDVKMRGKIISYFMMRGLVVTISI